MGSVGGVGALSGVCLLALVRPLAGLLLPLLSPFLGEDSCRALLDDRLGGRCLGGLGGAPPNPPARVPASPDPELRAWLASLGLFARWRAKVNGGLVSLIDLWVLGLACSLGVYATPGHG